MANCRLTKNQYLRYSLQYTHTAAEQAFCLTHALLDPQHRHCCVAIRTGCRIKVVCPMNDIDDSADTVSACKRLAGYCQALAPLPVHNVVLAEVAKHPLMINRIHLGHVVRTCNQSPNCPAHGSYTCCHTSLATS
jgi:hypothetical protein